MKPCGFSRGMKQGALIWLGLMVLVFTSLPGFGAAAQNQSTASGGILLLPGINISTLPYTYEQSFDNPPTSMPVSGSATWTDDSTVAGWSAKRSGSGTGVAAGTGASTAGNLYSFGAAGNAERALGSVGSNSAGNFFWGACFKNQSGLTITQLEISYDGEQWRKSGDTIAQTVDFAYAIGSDCVEVDAAAGWSTYDSLDFTSPVYTSGGAAVDGNTDGRVSLSASLAVSIAPAQAVTIRWSDPNHSGSDHGMAIDNLSLTALSAGGDSAPAVLSTTPADGASDVLPDAALEVVFSEAVAVGDGWVAITCSQSGAHSAGVSGGPQTFSLDPQVDFTSGETCGVMVAAALVTDLDANDPPDTMSEDYTWNFTVETPGAVTLIHAVQGAGAASPLSGQTVTIEAIVTGDFQSTVSGFFVQEEELDADSDPLTSEGVFVYSTTPVEAGDRVRVTGEVTEYYNETELSSVSAVSVLSSGNVLPAFTEVSLPVEDVTDWERYEGMRISFPQTLTVTEVYLLGRGGLLSLASQRLYQPTHLAEPGAPAQAAAAANARDLIYLDDGASTQNPDPIRFPIPGGLSAANTVRVGDQVSELQGVLTYRYHGWSGSASAYRLYPTADPTFIASNARPAAPEAQGELRVASFNVLNYFNGPIFPTSRGASSLVEFERQRAKIIAAIVGLDAEVIGLMEIENDGYSAGSAIQDLVDGLNAVAGAGTYAFIDPGTTTFGGDEIAVGLLYRPAAVTPLNPAAYTTDGAFTQETGEGRNRQPMAQTFQANASGEVFTVVVNHLKSKGSECTLAVGPFPADPDTGDGQGNCNLTRTMAAEDLLEWLASDPTGSGDADFLIIGDLNAYALEDPITALKDGGFVELVNTFQGVEGYSYVFNGQSGYLDHALASAGMAAQVVQAGEWHINTDEPLALDYNTEYKSAGQVSSLYAPDAYRSSDHDPVVIDLYLPDGTADTSDLGVSYGIAWHAGPHALYLGPDVTDDTSITPNGDDASDDGVVRLGGAWQRGLPASVRVTVSGGAGWLTGWIDWDLNGRFDADEVTINQAVGSGVNDITFTVPTDAQVGQGGEIQLAARFRLYESASEPGESPEAAQRGGGAAGGEVEDYLWVFSPTAVTLTTLEATPTALVGAGPTTWLALGLAIAAGAALGGVLVRR